MRFKLLGVEVDTEKQELVWNPRELQENIFEIVAYLSLLLGFEVVGGPKQIGDGKWMWKYEVRRRVK